MNNNLAGKIGIGILLICISFLLTGCPGPDYNYEAQNEEYLAGWVLHNPGSTTPSTLEYTINDVGIYDYTYNYPSYNPYSYYRYLSYVLPVPLNGGGFAVATGVRMGVPLTRTHYIYAYNPVPERYAYQWAYSNWVEMSHTSLFDTTQTEDTNAQGNMFLGPTPLPGERKTISYGGPYIPTSVAVENNTVFLPHPLLRGLGGSFVSKYTGIYTFYNYNTGEYDNLTISPPTYSLSRSGVVLQTGNLTSYDYGDNKWDEKALHYLLTQTGTYTLDIAIPSYAPTYNITTIKATFAIPSQSTSPPALVSLDASPRFSNASYPITVAFDDTATINTQDVKIRYRQDNGVWYDLSVTKTGQYFTAAASPNTAYAKIDLQIEATDAYGNKIVYTILPIALKEELPSLSPPELDKSYYDSNLSRGDTVLLTYGCTITSGPSCSGFLYEFYVNNKFVTRSTFDYYGDLELRYTIPFNSAENQLNITAVFNGTGVYKPHSRSDVFTITSYNYDIGISDLEIPQNLWVGTPYTFNFSLYNYGEQAVNNTNITFEFSTWNGTETFSIIVPHLPARNFSKLNFTWTPKVKDPYTYVYINAVLQAPLIDQKPGNNYIYDSVDVNANGPDIRGYTESLYSLIFGVNLSTSFKVYVENIGTTSATNIPVTLYVRNMTSPDHNYTLVNQTTVANLNVGELTTLTFAIKPPVSGAGELKLVTNATGDVYAANNEFYRSFTVRPAGVDLVLAVYPYAFYTIENNPIQFDINIFNEGLDTGNDVVLYIYEDNTLINTTPIGTISPTAHKEIEPIIYPSSYGIHKYTFKIPYTNDINPKDNIARYYVARASYINATFTLQDVNGQPIQREMRVNGKSYNVSGTITVPNVTTYKNTYYFLNFFDSLKQTGYTAEYYGARGKHTNKFITDAYATSKNENGLHIIYTAVTKPDWDYEEVDFSAVINGTTLNLSGLDLYYYYIYGCKDFDTSTKTCLTKWTKMRDASLYWYSSHLLIYMYTYSPEAEAFAIAIPDLDGDGIPDISDQDVDGDGAPNYLDSILGDGTSIKSNIPNLVVSVNGSTNLSASYRGIQPVRIASGTRTVAEFYYNFDDYVYPYGFYTLPLPELFLEEQTGSEKGRLIFSGIQITGTKNISIAKVKNNNEICIRDVEYGWSIKSVTPDCDDYDETLLTCDGTPNNGYACTNQGTYYFITGLNHTSVAQSCNESWSCGAWGACSGGVQTKTCTDANSCGTTVFKPLETQSCDQTNVNPPTNPNPPSDDTKSDRSTLSIPVADNKIIVLDPFTGTKTVSVSKNDIIRLRMQNTLFDIVVKNIFASTIELQMPVGTKNISLGVQKYYDFTSDGKNDIGILFVKNVLGKVDLELQALVIQKNTTITQNNITIGPEQNNTDENTTKEDKPEDKGFLGGNSLLVVLIAVLLVVVIIFIFVKATNKREKVDDFKKAKTSLSKDEQLSKEASLQKALNDYVKTALAKGLTTDQIEQGLIDAGWKRDVVDKKIAEINKKA